MEFLKHIIGVIKNDNTENGNGKLRKHGKSAL